MPSSRIRQFSYNISRARSLVGLGQAIAGMTFEQVDASDLFRSAHVQAVAALDSYIHGVILDYSIDIILGRRVPPASKGALGLHIGAISEIVSAGSPTDQELVARSHVLERISFETYQKPESIAKAFALVGFSQFWLTVFGDDAGVERTGLGLVVTRRNEIVHACDADPTAPGHVTDLSDIDAIAAVDRVERVVRSIDLVI